jgi:hypothetical protein
MRDLDVQPRQHSLEQQYAAALDMLDRGRGGFEALLPSTCCGLDWLSHLAHTAQGRVPIYVHRSTLYAPSCSKRLPKAPTC